MLLKTNFSFLFISFTFHSESHFAVWLCPVFREERRQMHRSERQLRCPEVISKHNVTNVDLLLFLSVVQLCLFF